VAEKFFIRELPNGLTLLGQPMDNVSSAAMVLALPAGASHDPPECAGAASVAADWCFRGAGERDTRQLNDALDSLGVQHHESVQSEFLLLSAALLGRNLPETLDLYADVVRRPRLEDKTFEPCRALVQQDLASLEDEPSRKANLLLREKFYPAPLGRCPYGTAGSLQALTADALRKHLQGRFSPRGATLSVAGAFEWEALLDHVGRRFGDWDSPAAPPVRPTPPAGGITHVPKDSAQVHIALAHRATIVSDRRYYAARLAATVLSGGMSGRLFTEVREKRGLVYHVSSHYHSLKDHAGMFTYAGTTPEKAQETLRVTVTELRRLGEGVTDDEMARARTQLKSALVMQGESTGARANALSSDWYHLRRLRSLEEISAAIDAITPDQVRQYLRDWPAANFTLLYIGPAELDTAAVL